MNQTEPWLEKPLPKPKKPPATKAKPKNSDQWTHYRQVADQYADDILSGKILSCNWVRLACERYQRDAKVNALDDSKGGRICFIIEMLPHIKGRWASKRELIKLEPWQVWTLFSLFGTVNEQGLRRYREAYISMGRKNSKSTLAAAIGLYMAFFDNEAGAEVYCGANSEKQAWEVFGPAHKMVEKLPDMQSSLGITVNARALWQDRTGSVFMPVIAKPGDGANVHCGICDEAHEWTDYVLYDAFKTGMTSREQPLLLTITTAGVDLASPCYDFMSAPG